MTSLSRRKRPTTVPRRRSAATAVKLAAVLAAFAVGGVAAGQFAGRSANPTAGKAAVYPRAEAVVPASADEPVLLPVPVPEQPAPLPRPALVAQPDKQPKTPVQPGQVPRVDPTQYTKLPPREQIFVLYPDDELERIIMNRIREDEMRRKVPKVVEQTLRFPVIDPAGAGVAYVPKTGDYPPVRGHYTSLQVIHRRLHFEEKNAERYGWDLGWIQPLVSALYFYRDVLLWPNSLASGFVTGWWDTNAGKCLPGSPTPYFLYPPGLTITGTAAEAAVITGAAFAFP